MDAKEIARRLHALNSIAEAAIFHMDGTITNQLNDFAIYGHDNMTEAREQEEAFQTELNNAGIELTIDWIPTRRAFVLIELTED